MHRISKILIVFLIIIGSFGLSYKPVYAIDCTTLSEDAPGPEEIVCPVAKVINILLLASGAILIIMLLVGGIKLALALGDPKGMQAASGTWTWAIVGFLVVVGAITLLTVVGKLVGWKFLNPFDSVQQEIRNFMSMLCIKGAGIPINPDCK